ncbi:Heat-labile enterotoxin, A chain [Metarhizium album ARSEF 1941]|uniref:Heat-labile enterotoxin, A chain n=1 Tax=Metarhizium album (strain ARSEF 1941) TaxID=1081103 RepID=A0A0B2WSA0_METAS|nr:Heat-labile enterotoxin, A chain [Metarhizium album ARSEF 1941]KHN96509.1 Heat-labile enterotoxin, A chain [Metarhizium album ARSEF 1941]
MLAQGPLTLLLCVLIACLEWSTGAHGLSIRQKSLPTLLYRFDTRKPEVIKKAGGFSPRSMDIQNEEGASVYLHMRGDPAGGAPKDSIYVSTTIDAQIAAKEVAAGREGYIYEIHATENMFSVSDTLKNHYIYLSQKEWVAVLGIRSDQIKSVAKVKARKATGAKPELEFKPFKGYNEAKYNGHTASPPEPQLAGFPPNHPALEEPQWKALSGKSLKDAASKFLKRAEAKGWELPEFREGGGCTISKRGLCDEAGNGAEDQGLKNPEKEGDEQVPRTGEEPPRSPELNKEGEVPSTGELVKSVEDVSSTEFRALAGRYKVLSFVENKLKLKLPLFRSDTLKYKPLGSALSHVKAPPSFGKLALKSLSKSFKALGLGLYAHGIIDAYANNVSAIDCAAALTAIIPVVGCATQIAADIAGGQANALDAIDDAMCVVGDVLLFNPATAPFGIAVHIARFIIGLIRAALPPPGPDPEVLREIKKIRDEAWTEFLQQHVYKELSSREFGDNMRSALATETLSLLSEGAQTIGVLVKSQELALNKTDDKTELEQLKSFFQNGTENVRKRLDSTILDAQRRYMINLVANVRDQDKNASIQAAADAYNDFFVTKNLTDAGADERIKQSIRGEKLPLPDSFTLAYLIGQGTAQDIQVPTQPAPEIEKALTSPDEKGLALRQAAANDGTNWEMHPLALSLPDYLQLKVQGLSKQDADTVSIRQTAALIKLFDGNVAEEDLEKASPKLEGVDIKEFQILAALNMGRKLKFWRLTEDRKLHFVPESAASNPAGTIASVLGLSEQDVQVVLEK